ncbi:glycosyltransferase family 2 protein [Gemella cuniculi]|uniref:glycosyltransferase family 2 protein n=1 Tax=Gemella cuniculi TaxID=150240 RepID=UPI00042670EF|nr:glycosyltransferase family 2 protein [Gemella cuniculi]
MLISVVVPVYNVENYLHYAMESLLRQTYKDFEVILVDDGSTDGSGKLCDEYTLKYENFFVYHKENGGLSDARNFGVEKSRGEFITFLDPDDYLESYALEFMVNIQKKYNVDIVTTEIKPTDKYNEYSKRNQLESDYKKVIVLSNKKALIEMFYDKKATVSACGKLYKREIVLNERFPSGKIYEDLYIISTHLKDTVDICVSELKVYNYYKRQGSIVNSTFTSKQYDFFEAIENNRNVIRENYGNDISIIRALNAKLAMGAFRISNSAAKNDMKDVLNIRNIIAKYYADILLNKRVSLKFKLKYIFFIISPKGYYKLKNIVSN